MNGAANALLWKSSKTQNFTYLTILKHQNTKTSLNELSKNHWVIALFEIFGSVRKKLQFTVFNDHPVEVAGKWCETELLLLLPMPSVVHDNLRPEAGLEDWRGEMGSAVSDWVAPQAPGFIHLQPRRLSLPVLLSTYLT